MNLWLFFGVIFVTLNIIKCLQCHFECPLEGEMVCGFDSREIAYKMFPSECAMKSYSVCAETDFHAHPLKYCIKGHIATRRMYGESCPVFCPNHYRPVCGASKYRDYIYRTFTNGCYLDMINCRGDDDYSGYIEVPLNYCQRHAMKNIYKEQVLISNMYDTRDYM